jgi:hypothetical protein
MHPLFCDNFTGGLLYVRDGANTQYVTGSSFLIAVFADYLTSAGDLLSCGDTSFTPRELLSHSKGQVLLHYKFVVATVLSEHLIMTWEVFLKEV